MKKFLALVLALVMTMSLVTMAGAEGFTDAADVDYAEAVDVLTKTGIVSGYTDGSVRPDVALNRGQAAKIICNMILGPTAAAALPTSVAPYADVPAGSTFAGYIAYLAKEGLVSGYADGTFQPTAPLTGYAFMKMLLGVIGYDAAIEGYTGSNWAVSVAKQALADKLYDGVQGEFVGTKTVTRQEAMLYAFNALKAEYVTYEDKGANITIGGVVIQTGATEPKKAAATSAYFSTKKTTYLEKLFGTDLVYNGTGDEAFNRPSHIWTYKGEKVGTYASAPAVTLVGKKTAAEVAAALNGYYVDIDATSAVSLKAINNGDTFTSETIDCDIYVHGASLVNNLAADLTVSTETIAKALADETEHGKVIELYKTKNTDGKYYISSALVLWYVVDQVEDITTDSKGNVTYEFENLLPDVVDYADNANNTDGLKVYGTIAKEDIITACVDKNGKWHVYPTTQFVGQQTAISTSGVATIGGATFQVGTGVDNGAYNTPLTYTDFPNQSKAYNYYLDINGYLVATNAVKAPANYAVVDDLALVNGSGTGAKKSVEAVLVFADGTSKVVEVSKINGVKTKDVTDAAASLDTSAAGVVSDLKISSTVTNNTALTGVVVTYKIVDDKYELTYLNLNNSLSDATTKAAIFTSVATATTSGDDLTVIEKGVPSIASISKYGDNDTIYIIKTLEADGVTEKFASYVGYKNVPSVKLDYVSSNISAYVAYTVETDEVAAAVVYVDATAANVGDSATGDMLFVTSNTYTTHETDEKVYYTFKGIVNGVAGVTVKTDDATVLSTLSNSSNKEKLYELKTDSEGYVTLVTEMTTSTATKYEKATVDTNGAKNGVLDTDDVDYTFDGDETVYVIDTENEYAVRSGDVKDAKTGDTVYVKVVKYTNGTASEQIAISTMYIVK